MSWSDDNGATWSDPQVGFTGCITDTAAQIVHYLMQLKICFSTSSY